MLSGYTAVKRLARERSSWIPIVESCLEEANQVNGEFAGAWVLERAKKRGISWFPNLRLLVSYGILKHEDTTRGGRRNSTSTQSQCFSLSLASPRWALSRPFQSVSSCLFGLPSRSEQMAVQ